MSLIGKYGAAWLFSTVVACVCSAQSLPSIFSSDVAAKVTQLTGQVSISKIPLPGRFRSAASYRSAR